ncbi:Mu-like prophage FluMu I protein [Halomonas citrativorans]|uniref:Mu-like prophage FluMu I protein n=1 Tax=Halomonas citrativorans TaxID=2742612 RepID=A0A1R4HVK1_9GAMM|nr:phage protease [Halomonas citrativorans]SJN11631.1 Mu-like prophage FluMu I protein [Halomonas citrativorans]
MKTHSLHTKPRVAVCALSVQTTNDKTRLMPSGTFHAPRGAAEGTGPWHLSAEQAQAIIRLAAARSTDIAIDYEHQTLYAEQNGKPAPASGWVDPRSLEYREDGLYGSIDWTAAAKAAIDANEYRYLSPVFPYDAQGQPLDLLHLGLTNTPAIDEGAAQLAAARLSVTHDTPEEIDPVKREQLITTLGLATDATDEQIDTAIAALKAGDADAKALREALGAKDDAKPAEAVAALKASSATAAPDMSQYVPKAVYEETTQQLAALKAGSQTAELDALIKDALDDGRIPGQATADWLRKQGLAACKAHLDGAPSIAALKTTQTQGKQPEDTNAKGELTESELAVCKSMGITAEQYRAANPAQ